MSMSHMKHIWTSQGSLMIRWKKQRSIESMGIGHYSVPWPGLHVMWVVTAEHPFAVPALFQTPGIGWQRETHRSQTFQSIQHDFQCNICQYPESMLTPFISHQNITISDVSVEKLSGALEANGTTLQDCLYMLTGVNLLQRDVLLQLSAQFDLCPILPTCAVITEDEMRVAAVENG